MSIQSPRELLILKSIRNAESEAAQAIGNFAQDAVNEELEKLLEERIRQGKEVLAAAEKGLKNFGDEGKATEVNSAVRGIIRDAEILINQTPVPELKQAIIIASAQKLEHYCIATWGVVKAIAAEAGEQELTDAMQRALDEGQQWDRELTQLAENRVNPEGFEV